MAATSERAAASRSATGPLLAPFAFSWRPLAGAHSPGTCRDKGTAGSQGLPRPRVQCCIRRFLSWGNEDAGVKTAKGRPAKAKSVEVQEIRQEYEVDPKDGYLIDFISGR